MPDTQPTAEPGASEENPGLGPSLGYECHDCGEIFAPGSSTADCVEQGHYVGPIQACALPSIAPVSND
jgi:hypothetical protein